MLGAVACGSSGENTARVSEPIIGGSVDTSDAAVVALSQPSTGMLCSGALVAPSLVLTAAHCVSGLEASSLQVLVGSDVTSPDQTVAVTASLVYPTYLGESEGVLGGVDLAFVSLATPLSLTPVPVRTDTTDAELTGADVTVIGYGASDGTDNSGAGTRREVVLEVTSVCSRIIQAGDADANACVGDSGGAVMLGGQLVAVVSGGREGCYTPAVFTRTDAHADWIAAVLAGSGSAACPACFPPDPSCTAATETQPATAPADAGSGGSAPESSTDAIAVELRGGSCETGSGPSGAGSWCALAVGSALLARRRRYSSDASTHSSRASGSSLR